MDGSERWPSAYSRIVAAGFPSVQRFSAVNGKKMSEEQKAQILTPRAFADLGTARHRHEELGSAGAVGCFLSHYSIWAEMVRNNWQRCIVFEDDVVFPTNENVLAARLGECMAAVPDQANSRQSLGASSRNVALPVTQMGATSGATQTFDRPMDALFFGYFWGRDSVPVNAQLDLCHGKVFGTHAYLLTLSGARKLVARAFPIDCQVDAYFGAMTKLAPNPLTMYMPKRSLVHQDWGTFGSGIQSVRDLKVYVPPKPSHFILGTLLCVAAVIIVVWLVARASTGKTWPALTGPSA
jgi:GR25 family glycosyltransferase involved in LPS biosynthesis